MIEIKKESFRPLTGIMIFKLLTSQYELQKTAMFPSPYGDYDF